MVTGITNLTLAPLMTTPDVSRKLAQAMSNAVRMRSAIAFWTISGGDRLGIEALRLLRNAGSFMCVDIHRPTNLDVLHSMSVNSANLFLHLRQINIALAKKSPEYAHLVADGMPKHLMHQKTVLLDYQGGEAELWVGSHNWTGRALKGPNVESSVVINLKQESDVYREAVSNLERVRDICKPMDVNKLAWYKALQGGDDPFEMITALRLTKYDDMDLRGQLIYLVGTNERQLSQRLRSLNRDFLVEVTDQPSRKTVLYDAEVRQTNHLPMSATPAPAPILTTPARWAEKIGSTYPTLQAAGLPPARILNNSAYWVSIQLRDQVPGELYEMDRRPSPWMNAENDPLNDWMRDDSLADDQVGFSGSAIPIQIPNETWQESSPALYSLEDKLASTKMPLIERKMIQRPEQDEE